VFSDSKVNSNFDLEKRRKQVYEFVNIKGKGFEVFEW
jgi:hypothetical protein